MSIYLYASKAWKAEVGFGGRFEGDLGIPANSRFLDRAPYPFTSRGVRTEPGLGDGGDLELVVEQEYALGAPGKAARARKIRARIFAPRFEPDVAEWTCAVNVTAPLVLELRAVGRTSLQALFGGLAVLSDHLYGSEAYREGRLGWIKPLRSPLLLPATAEMLDVAPYPF